jgi:hypothetical protein
LLDSRLQIVNFSANEDALTPTKYVQVNQHELGRLN